MQGTLTLPKMAGEEISPDVWCIDEPHVNDQGQLVCLANVRGSLCLIELTIKPLKE